jgi:HAD superfamily hydrolase (TIGR01450 family)
MNNISALAFDLDGTIYCGNSAIEGAVGTINTLASLNYKIFYFTNNSAKTREQIVHKLKGMGLSANPLNTYCVTYAIAIYLKEKRITEVYLIGSRDLENELLLSNIKIRNNGDIGAVVIGLDQSFDYNKISLAQDAINNGAKLIIANNDSSYPIEHDRRLPGCGSIVAAVVGATLHFPDFIVGKPNTYMLELLCKDHKLLPEQICVIGDSLGSDIKMAENFKCQSILFDPLNAYSGFSGTRVDKLKEIISIIQNKRDE